MQLPVRIASEGLSEPVISVDGAWNAPGLNLSHWPGHRTPAQFAHELSTGCALAFARLAQQEREHWARGCVAIVNNHFDTDGTCALFAVRHPALALERERALLEAAAAGDFFELPSDAALRVDLIVAGCADPERSPLAEQLRERPSLERHQLATEFLLERLPAILDGESAPYENLWRDELERTHADLAELERCARDEVAHLDWTTFVARPASEPFAPGRHALFGVARSDRVLVASPCRGGAHFRLIFGTRSWFETPGRERTARPDLHALVAQLNQLEGVSAQDALAWRAQPADSPSPEVWFGAREQDFFAERSSALRPSALPIAQVRHALAQCLRASLALPQ